MMVSAFFTEHTFFIDYFPLNSFMMGFISPYYSILELGS